MSETIDVDTIVIGGSIRGLVAAYVSSSLGYRTIVVERAPHVGGADGSFRTAEGTTFDFGLHVLDAERSPLATRLFSHVVDGRVHRTVLKRGMVLRNRLVEYAAEPARFPAELRELLASDELVDDIGAELPTRQAIARCYGPGYADLIFDEVLPSYPSENRHRELGVDEAQLMRNIYPWFFPRATYDEAEHDESRSFHDRLRRGVRQEVLYPENGGFGGFARGFCQKIEELGGTVQTSATDVHIEVDAGEHRIRWVETSGKRYRARHYFWAAGWPGLCKLLDIPVQNVATDVLVLGSFRFDAPITTDYHELLVGDPQHEINRITRPAGFRGSAAPLLQIEFAFPAAHERSLAADEWKQRWLASLRRLGLIGDSHEAVEFDFKSVKMHFNSYGMEGEPLIDADASSIRDDANIHPVVPSMANLNLNSHVPRTVRYVTEVCAGL